MDTKIGIVGFFDILGYQNLLENNEPENVAEIVLPFLTGIRLVVTDEMKNLYDLAKIEAKSNIQLIDRIIDSIKWLVFSDTILLTMPVQYTEDVPVAFHWSAFFIASISLQTKMFRKGLPLRGAINYGKFYIKDTCFAGRAIVEAYQLCNKLELAACVLTERSRQELDKTNKRLKDDKPNTFCDVFVREYLVPTKDGESRMLTLSAHLYDNEREDDIKSQVIESFSGYNKDIPFSVQKKIVSTEQWLRILKLKRK